MVSGEHIDILFQWGSLEQGTFRCTTRDLLAAARKYVEYWLLVRPYGSAPDTPGICPVYGVLFPYHSGRLGLTSDPIAQSTLRTLAPNYFKMGHSFREQDPQQWKMFLEDVSSHALLPQSLILIQY